MVANILPIDPPPLPPTTLGHKIKGQNSTFSEHGQVAYQIKGNHKCSKMVTPTLWMGSIGQNSTISEHGHVAYQIIGNHEMQQHGSKYFAHRPLTPDPS